MDRCVIGLYREDTPIAYRELDLDYEWELINFGTPEDEQPPVERLKFKDSVDANELPFNDMEVT